MELKKFYKNYCDYYNEYNNTDKKKLDCIFMKLYIKELSKKFKPKEIQKF